MSAACAVAVLSGCTISTPGIEAETISRAGAIDQGMGAVVLSVRSAIFLDEPLDVYFLREGGDITNEDDIVVFERKQGGFSLKNDTVRYQPQAFALAPGTYRLVAHGMECDAVPLPTERCRVERRIMGRLRLLSRPSRGYGPIAPTFEVRAGQVTYAGDFALTGRNKIEWSPIPDDELGEISADFANVQIGPEPVVPVSFELKYPLVARNYTSDMGRQY